MQIIDATAKAYLERNKTAFDSFQYKDKNYATLYVEAMSTLSKLCESFKANILKMNCSYISKKDMQLMQLNLDRAQLEISHLVRGNPPHHSIDTQRDIISTEEVIVQIDRIYKDILKISAKDIGVTVLDYTFQIDKEHIELNKRKIAPDVDCCQYAFYKARVQENVDWVLGYSEKQPDPTFVKRTLAKEFHLVDVPKAGDFIVYLNEDYEKIHIGIFTDTDRIISKWGSCPPIFSHPIHASPYGHSYLVYRKNS